MTIISLFGSWSIARFNVSWLSWAQQSKAHVSAGQCLKFCDDTPSAAMLPNLFKQDGAPAHRSRHTVAYWRSNSLRRKTGHRTARILIRLIMQFGAIAADGVSSQNFRHWPAETCAYRLLGSAKSGHIESSDRSAAKRLMMVIKAKGAHVEFRLV